MGGKNIGGKEGKGRAEKERKSSMTSWQGKEHRLLQLPITQTCQSLEVMNEKNKTSQTRSRYSSGEENRQHVITEGFLSPS